MQQDAAAVWYVVFIGAFAWMNPESAAGAVFGGMFFWAFNPQMRPRMRFLLVIASIGAGYGMSLPAARSTEWAAWAWGVACLCAALIHVALESMRQMITTGSPLPPWLKEIVSSLPFFGRKNRGDNQ